MKSGENIFSPKLLIEQILEKDFWHFWAKNCKNGPCTKVNIFHFCQLFLTESKSVKNEKFSSPQMIRVCEIKFPLFKIKNGFLAIFVILAKTRKWPKIHFFFRKVEIFLPHKIQLGRPKFFSFYIFDLVKKSGGKWKKGTFLHEPFF